ncbi:MAG TPA: DUF892 family protein [Puia sp.]|jgi:ferritin-like metal-binding protein YciE
MKSTGTGHIQNDSQIQHRAKAEKIKSVVTQNLRELFLSELRSTYWSEKAVSTTIPKMIRQTTAHDLSELLAGHLEITRDHVMRLEEIFSVVSEKISAVRCEAVEGMIKEAGQIMEQTEKGKVRDAGIISAAFKIGHYKIATYGTLCFFAKTLGENSEVALLHKILEEEKKANEKLSEIIELRQLEMAD